MCIKKTVRLVLLVAALLGLLGLAPIVLAKPAGKKKGGGRPAPAVNTVTVSAKTWAPSIDLNGSLRAYQGIDIKSQVNGVVTKLYFKSGQTVQSGQKLLQIFPNILEANYKAAVSSFELAKANFDRKKTLYSKNAGISKADLETAYAGMLSAQSAVVVAKANMEESLIRAPFSGKLGVRFVSLGQYVKAGQKIVNLQDTASMYVDFSVPQVYLSELQLGIPVTVTVNAYPKEKFVGKITSIGTAVNEDTRAIVVRATLAGNNPKLVPGSYVQVKLDLAQPSKVITVPLTAVTYDQDKRYVFLVKNSKAVKTEVTLGKRGRDDIIVKTGLKVGDCIVTDGAMKVSDKQSLQIISGCK